MIDPRYWIIVASREHVMLGVAGGVRAGGSRETVRACEDACRGPDHLLLP
jgi:hypothetical protein